MKLPHFNIFSKNHPSPADSRPGETISQSGDAEKLPSRPLTSGNRPAHKSAALLFKHKFGKYFTPAPKHKFGPVPKMDIDSIRNRQMDATERLFQIKGKPFENLNTTGELHTLLRDNTELIGDPGNPLNQKSEKALAKEKRARSEKNWVKLLKENQEPALHPTTGSQLYVAQRKCRPLTDLVDSMGLLTGISGIGFQDLARLATPEWREALSRAIEEKQSLAMPGDLVANAEIKRLKAIEVLTRPIDFPHESRSTMTLLELDDLAHPIYEQSDAAIPPGVTSQLSEALEDARDLLNLDIREHYSAESAASLATALPQQDRNRNLSTPDVEMQAPPLEPDATEQIMDLYKLLPDSEDYWKPNTSQEVIDWLRSTYPVPSDKTEPGQSDTAPNASPTNVKDVSSNSIDRGERLQRKTGTRVPSPPAMPVPPPRTSSLPRNDKPLEIWTPGLANASPEIADWLKAGDAYVKAQEQQGEMPSSSPPRSNEEARRQPEIPDLLDAAVGAVATGAAALTAAQALAGHSMPKASAEPDQEQRPSVAGARDSGTSLQALKAKL